MNMWLHSAPRDGLENMHLKIIDGWALSESGSRGQASMCAAGSIMTMEGVGGVTSF